MRKICYLTGTRAEFGLMQKILQAIQTDKKLELILLATGMHLLTEFGETINEVKAEFPRVKIIDATYEEDSRLSMARFVGRALSQLVEVLDQVKPDLVLVLGDRGEQLAMATASAYLAIPVIHLHGGEKTSTVDDKARNAITMLTDWHLPASNGAGKKLKQMGIDKHRIKIVGAPGLDQIQDLPAASKKDCLIILQHPDKKEEEAAWQIQQTLEAVIEFKLPVKVIYPNSDAGGRKMIKVIEEFKQQYPQLIETRPSLERLKFLQLLGQARVLIGNSSSGLIEAPALNLAAINIGPRQKGREQAKNIINVDYNRKQIIKAISKTLSWRLKNVKNPYGNGKTTERVIKFLKRI
ncbi:MAG: UDP-N-acetylglucosamine 2-epimerase [Patescibacteria group bacterium]|nr:UDP-N-acetylglucosamine 2-epimerase [Patescibacteria group bacterium]